MMKNGLGLVLVCMFLDTLKGSTPSTTVQLHGDVEKLGYVYVKAKSKGGFYDFRLLVDTGSQLTYLPCTGCSDDTCGSRKMGKLMNRKHETNFLRCDDMMCPKVEKEMCWRIPEGETDDCFLEEVFPGGGSLSGVYVASTLSIDKYSSWSTVGCVQEMSKNFQDQFVDGAIGFDPDSKFIYPKANGWKMCLARNGFYGGNLTIGSGIKIDPNGVWVEAHRRKITDPYSHRRGYVIALDHPQMQVGNTKVATELGEHHTHAVIDTGSPLTWLPDDLFSALRKELFTYCENGPDDRCGGNKRVTGDAESLACFDITDFKSTGNEKSLNKTSHGPTILKPHLKQLKQMFALKGFYDSLPKISIIVKGQGTTARQLEIDPREYIYERSAEKTYCIGLMNSPSRKDPENLVIGINILRGWEITADLKKRVVRFEPCKQAFDLAAAVTDTDPDRRQYGDNSASIQAAVGTFFLFFILTMIFLCCCRLVCNSPGPNYQNLNKHEFGTGDQGEGNPLQQTAAGDDRYESSTKFSIGSVDDDSEEEFAHEQDDSDDDQYITEKPSKNGYHRQSKEEVDDLVGQAEDLLAS